MSESEQPNQPSEKLAEIFSKMSMSELPAMSTNVQELISLTCSSRSAGAELAKVILKDYSLTNKLLQVVNSAYYSMGRPVNSVSRAVAVLGFDAVREMATGIALFEEFIKCGMDKESISKVLTRSFLSAIQARDLVKEKKLKVTPEEAFICTLLHNLGKIIVCIYLPDKFREFEELVESGVSEKAAEKSILSDITFLEIGEEVAKFWNLSEKVVSSMNSTPPAPKSKSDSEGYLHNVVCFSNELVGNICDGADLGGLMDKYGEMFSVEPESLVESVQRCVEESEDVSDSIRYGLSKLKIRNRLKTTTSNVKNGVFSSLKPGEKKQKIKMVVDDQPSSSKNSQQMVVDDQPSSTKNAQQMVVDDQPSNTTGIQRDVSEPENVLDEASIGEGKSVNEFVRDITETLMGNFNLNDFYANLLQGLFQGIGFDRVILAVVSVQPSKISLVGRFGLGDIDQAAVKKFEHILAAGQYAIPNALRLCKDMMISGDKQASAFPENLQYLVKGRNVYLFPICIDKKGIGLIYLDRKLARPVLTKDEVKNVRLFRDFAVMAIKKLRKKS